MKEAVQNREKTNSDILSEKIDGIGWSLFFIWIGIALLIDIAWGGTFVGFGVILIAMQLVRTYNGLRMEGFSIAVGLLFILAGSWELFQVRFGLLPILCISAGVIFLIFTLIKKPSPRY